MPKRAASVPRSGSGSPKMRERGVVPSVDPAKSTANASPEPTASQPAHGLRVYLVRWRYAGMIEMPRISTVHATTKAAARARVLQNHIEPDSQIRKAIEWLD